MRTALNSLFALLALVVGIATGAQTTFTSSDKSLSFVHPDSWKVSEEGGRVTLKTVEGVTYLVQLDVPGTVEKTEPSTSKSLRDAAETLAKSILKSVDYAGVKLLTVGGGNGAIFRFRGQGSKSDYDLVEVYIGVFNGHSMTVSPTTSPVPDYSFELGVIFQNLNNKAPAQKIAGPATVTQKNKSVGKSANKAGGAATTVDTNSVESGKVIVPVNKVMEVYEGHLLSGDAAFSLTLNHDNSAIASWERTIGNPIMYSGTFAGADGNYDIKLTQSAGGSIQGPSPLVINLRSLGGQIGGQFSAGLGNRPVGITMLRLTAVDSGNIKMQGSSPNRSRATSGRKRTVNSARGRPRMVRRIRIIKPNYSLPPNPL